MIPIYCVLNFWALYLHTSHADSDDYRNLLTNELA